MKIGIIDADLLGRTRHRFPNLACEKISAYWKEKGANVSLLMNYDNLNDYDHVYISKVFTDTPFPENIKENDKIHLGGTGFYFDKAPNLPEEIEHHQPDYYLYDKWIEEQINNGISRNEFKEYLDYSVGFLTRGCFRKCKFCVNQKYNHVFIHSPLEEFYDPSKKKICMLDDNFFGCPKWKELLEELIKTKKPFKFKQGLDERLLTDEKCEMLFNCKYDGCFTFAFDNVSDYDLIKTKLQMIRRHTKTQSIMFYVLVGFESTDYKDIENAFIRISLLLEYGCVPYIMRYQNKNETPWKTSKYREMYIALARWCNQPSMLKKKSFREFCELNQEYMKSKKLCSAMRALTDFEKDYPKIAKKYFDIKYKNPKEYKMKEEQLALF